ncbi:hypothetical protein GQ600_17676 [Phytophthora cactorum]|nr:hypothetical protein GQ600_17676 [Phytophthora cactorum]
MNGKFGLMFDGWTSDGILSQVLLSISPAEYGQSAEAYLEMIDAVLELYNKDSAMNHVHRCGQLRDEPSHCDSAGDSSVQNHIRWWTIYCRRRLIWIGGGL